MRGPLANAFLVLAIATLVGGIAWAFSSSQPKEYGSSMQLEFSRLVSPELQLLGPAFGEPDVDEDVKMNTHARGVESVDVADATARRNPQFGMTGGEIAARVQASPIRGTLLVEVTGQATKNAYVAAVLVRAYVNEYLRLRKKRSGRRAATVQAALRKRLRALPASELSQVRGVVLRDQIATLDVLREVGTGTPTIVHEPRVNRTPVKPKTQRDVIFAVLFGLGVGAGLVALRGNTRTRATVAAARQVARARGAPPPPH